LLPETALARHRAVGGHASCPCIALRLAVLVERFDGDDRALTTSFSARERAIDDAVCENFDRTAKWNLAWTATFAVAAVGSARIPNSKWDLGRRIRVPGAALKPPARCGFTTHEGDWRGWQRPGESELRAQ
jgi:hypothetical protein